MTPKLSSKRTVFNDYRKLVEATFSVQDSKVVKWVYLDCPSSVVILPVDSSNNIIVIKQFRYPHVKYTRELPCGFVDKGETVEEAARRELLEETLCSSSNLTVSAPFMNMQGETNRQIYYVLAKDPCFDDEVRGKLDLSFEEISAGLSTEKILFEEAYSKLVKGKSLLDGIESNFALFLFASQILG
ncbi:NUDIX hydrolase [Candidatus Dojkabacteria bacterium]|uniref:NUDIX hydrolase n=1 Tax=Candidatus Dojkabacteria bacterium TaxID=2099670 RepID=A0A955RHJ4_9BACT|nr:NUDIX hydrolase [Candidatus Dojkabacteria bacterium]